MTSRLLPGLVACVAATSTACVVNLGDESVVVRDERRFTVTGDADVALTTFDGPIRVQSWDRDEVLVEIEKRGPTRQEAERLEVRATQDGNRIRVEAPRGEGQRSLFRVGSFASPSVSLTLSVPRRLSLRAETGDGSITAQRLTGRLELRSGDGSVRGDDIEGDLRVNTGDGSVTVVDVRGRADLGSGDGSIDVRGRLDALRVDTGDGSVDVEAEPGSVMTEDWTITTGDGSITLRVAEGFSAEIDAESGDGTVRADGATLTADRGGEEGQWLRGRLGSGGRRIRLRSGDGSIRILSR